MAEDNKNFNKLASDSSDSKTSRLEVLSVDLVPGDEEFEMDADTFPLDDEEPAVSHTVSLGSGLAAGQESAAQLKLELQKLRSRCNGLEKEISAREELTVMLQADLKKAHRSLSARDTERKQLKDQLESLEQGLDATTARATELEDERGTLRSRVEELEGRTGADAGRIRELEEKLTVLESAAEREGKAAAARIAELESHNETLSNKVRDLGNVGEEDQQTIRTLQKELESTRQAAEQNAEQQSERIRDLEQELGGVRTAAREKELTLDEALAARLVEISELKDFVESRTVEWDGRGRRLEELSETVEARDETIVRQRRQFERLDAEFDRVRAQRNDLETRLRVLNADHVDARAKLKAARLEIAAYAEGEQEQNRRLIAEQRGTIARLEQTTAELQGQLEQREAYAERLRRQWSASQETVEELQATIDTLKADLDETRSQSADLEERLASETAQNEEKERAIVRQREALEARIAALRYELGEVRPTIAGRAPGGSENESGQEATPDVRTPVGVTDLEKRIRGLEQVLRDTESKIVAKDNAIHTLLTELADRDSEDGGDEIEHVLQEIDGRMSLRIDARAATGATGEKDRSTRQLVGSIDGQELRFPLFKDRLSIGRTAQNDIQLRAQFVSRRHALILVEEEATKIVDWGSKNGIFVNGDRVSEHLLTNGDTVTIGNAEFVYEERPRRESS